MTATRTAVLLVTLATASLGGGGARAGEDTRAIDAIEHDLVADDAAVRAKAAAELAGRFPDGAVALPMLVDLLDDESPDVAAAAANSIDAMAVAGADVLIAYFGDIEQWKPGSRLEQLVPTLTQVGLGADLLRPDEVRAGTTPLAHLALVGALPRTPLKGDARGSAEPSLVAILRVARDARRDVCAAALTMRAADAVTSIREPAATSSPPRDAALAAALHLVASKRDTQRWAGERIVARLRPASADAHRALLDVLAAPVATPSVEASIARLAAYQAFDAIGPAAGAAAPRVMEALSKETDPTLQLAGAHAVARIGADADVAAWATKDGEAARSLALELAARSRVRDVLMPRFVKGLEGAAEDEKAALTGIASFGPAAASALDTLKARAPSDARDARAASAVRRRALYAKAILAVDPADAGSFGVLDELSRDMFAGKMLENAAGRPIEILARYAAPTARLVTRLQEAADSLEDVEDACALRVLEGVARCRELSAPIVPDLVRLLSAADTKARDPATADRFSPQRRAIVVALGRIGPAAGVAVAPLTALRDNGDETIRVPAAQALRRIKAKK